MHNTAGERGPGRFRRRTVLVPRTEIGKLAPLTRVNVCVIGTFTCAGGGQSSRRRGATAGLGSFRGTPTRRKFRLRTESAFSTCPSTKLSLLISMLQTPAVPTEG